jgi:preprotein translocase subunit SecE
VAVFFVFGVCKASPRKRSATERSEGANLAKKRKNLLKTELCARKQKRRKNTTAVMKRLISYIKGAYNELVNKVTWPSFKELQNSTVIVMVASVIIAVVILCMDLVFENLMKTVYNILY